MMGDGLQRCRLAHSEIDFAKPHLRALAGQVIGAAQEMANLVVEAIRTFCHSLLL